MSEVPRWRVDVMEDEYGRPWPHHVPDTNGPCVAYDAHVAAVAAAEQRGYGRGLDLDYDDRIKAAFDYGREYQQQRLTSHDMHSGLACLTNYERGVKAAREAVEAENKNPISRVTTDYDIGYRDGTNDTVRLHLRAIDALRGGS